MDYISYLSRGLERILSDDPDLATEIRDRHPRVDNELAAAAVRGGARESRGFAEGVRLEGAGDVNLASLETIVRKTGRPVLTVRDNDFTFSTTDVESEV